jgi:putative phosphoesterase
MKIGILSDTHLKTIPEHLGEAIAHHFKDADMILHAGDVVEAGVLDYFAGRVVKAVAGNMDSSILKDRNPVKMVLPIEGFKVGLIHGWGSPVGIEDRIRGEFEDIDILVFGHTHNATSHTKDGVLFFNPGSPTCKRFAAQNTIGILEIGERINPRIITIE